MSNQPTERSRSGHAPDRRDSESRRARAWSREFARFLALVCAFASASAAWAAEVVEVRVGRHPDFTRVVFELDRAAGYRIERSDPASKTAELIVSLEAGSIPRRIQSSKSFIEQVVVEPSGARSVARIRLAKGGLKLKEMILASPPRIVLDVLSEKEGSPVVAAKSPATTPKPAVVAKATPAPATAAAEKKTAAAPKPISKPEPKTASPTSTTAAASKPTASSLAAAPSRPVAPVIKSEVATPAPTPKTKVLARSEGSQVESAKRDAQALPPSAPGAKSDAATEPTANKLASEDATSTRSDSAGTRSDPSAAAKPGAAEGAAPDEVELARREAESAEPKAAETDRPMVVQPPNGAAWGKEEEEEGGGLLRLALVGAGALVVAFLGLVVVRRRRAAEADAADVSDEDFASPFGQAEGGEEVADESSANTSSNPFAGLAGGSPSLATSLPSRTATQSAATAPAASPAARGAERPADRQEKKPSESLFFDDAEEKTMEGMEVISRSQANETLGGAMPMMGGASDELMQMFREMQRRVTALETRIDELVDARDRLERQVAAQTEELRVQRAAIARTQRAVRNLARPEDAGDDEPTEPALREPN